MVRVYERVPVGVPFTFESRPNDVMIKTKRSGTIMSLAKYRKRYPNGEKN